MPIPFTCPHCGRVTNVPDQYAGQSGPCAGCKQTITIPAVGTAPVPGQPVAYRTPPTRSTSTWLFATLALVLVCLCGGGGLVTLLVREIRTGREVPQSRQCSNNLKQIALAMHNYHDVHKCFPAAYVADEDGKPLHSWRVALLPYLEQGTLYDQYNFNEPWDSPNNMLVAQQMPDIFRCPECPSAMGSNVTNYVVVVGDPSVSPSQSMFMPNHWTRMGEISDGTSNTIMVIETMMPVPWTQPDADPKFDQFAFGVDAGPYSISSYHNAGPNVALADGSVSTMSRGTLGDVLRAMIQPADGQLGPDSPY